MLSSSVRCQRHCRNPGRDMKLRVDQRHRLPCRACHGPGDQSRGDGHSLSPRTPQAAPSLVLSCSLSVTIWPPRRAKSGCRTMVPARGAWSAVASVVLASQRSSSTWSSFLAPSHMREAGHHTKPRRRTHHHYRCPVRSRTYTARFMRRPRCAHTRRAGTRAVLAH